MTAITTTLLCAVRYSHFRSLGVYREVQAAIRAMWPTLSIEERDWLLGMLRTQTVPETRRDALGWGARSIPVSAMEALKEAKSWEDFVGALENGERPQPATGCPYNPDDHPLGACPDCEDEWTD